MRDLKWILFLLVLSIGALWIIPHVFAEDSSSTRSDSYVVVDYEAPAYSGSNEEKDYTIHFLNQGDVVYLGDHIDISGALGGTKYLAYWGSSGPSSGKIKYIIELPYQKSGWYNFYLDPKIFSDKTGDWHKWSGYYEPNGNTLAFTVRAMFRNTTATFPNGTVIETSELVSGDRTPENKVVELPLPDKRESDYLVTTEETLNVSVSKPSAVWIFNWKNNHILYSTGGGLSDIVINQAQISDLLPGSYKMIIQHIGNLSDNLDVKYDIDSNKIKWFDRKSFEVREIDTTTMVPEIAIKTLSEIFPETRDEFFIKNISVMHPEITINRMDRISMLPARDFYNDYDLRGNVSVMDVRGYTNVLPGTNITLIVDEERTDPRSIEKSTYRTKSLGNFDGNWRCYQIYVPIIKDQMSLGMHTITVRTEVGGEMKHDFPIEDLPADSYIPEERVRYIGERNPWVPTPTPETKIVKEKEIIKETVTVKIPVTPSNEQVYEQQKKVVGEWIFIAAVCIIVALGMLYLVSLYLRKRSMGL